MSIPGELQLVWEQNSYAIERLRAWTLLENRRKSV